MAIVIGSGLILITVCDTPVRGPTRSFKSPNYPMPYGKDMLHTWCIFSDDGCPMTLTFRDIQLDVQEHKCHDAISVFDGGDPNRDKMIGTVCENVTIKLTSSKAWVVFQTDNQTEKRGFEAEYDTLPCDKHFLTATTDPLTFTLNKNRNSESWVIEATMGNVHIDFTRFSLSQSEHCGKEKVKIFDGADDRNRMLGEHCGQVDNLKYTSTDKFLYVSYCSEGTKNEGLGFLATYCTVGIRK
ncbi:zinc metalloproteinase nas-39-like isoform X2 [Ornithodoros turicata]|uniref:zinc metalloproteinase nas-39-like isoform X2 n=1 Tax=Ornithodoros turicata TaxID=34597 RepID=UPI003138DF9C